MCVCLCVHACDKQVYDYSHSFRSLHGHRITIDCSRAINHEAANQREDTDGTQLSVSRFIALERS